MNPGPPSSCGEYPSGQTIYRSFSWTAREGNTVDVYYAYTDADVQATSGFVLLGSGMPPTGTVQLSRVCPNGAGTIQLITVKVVANTTAGSATAFWWGL